MAVTVKVPYQKSFTVPQSRDKVFAYLTDVRVAVPACFPGLVGLDEMGPDTYRWVFEKLGYSGYEIQIKLVTKFSSTALSEVRADPTGGDSNSRFKGAWSLSDDGSGCQISFSSEFEIDLPIPFFVKAVAVPLAQQELTKLFDRYVERLKKNLA